MNTAEVTLSEKKDEGSIALINFGSVAPIKDTSGTEIYR